MVLKEFIKKNTDPIKDTYYSRLAKIESGNNPNARANTSTASGLYQFTEGTWKGLTKELGLDYSLDDRFNPEKSQKVVEEFTKRNKSYLLRKTGKVPNDAELYLAHFSGMGGASKLLKTLQENPDTSVTKVFGENQIKANRNVFLNKDGSYKKVKDVYNWAAKKFDVPEYNTEAKTESNNFRERRPGTVVESTRTRQPSLSTPPINGVTRRELLQFNKLQVIDQNRINNEQAINEAYNFNKINQQQPQQANPYYDSVDDNFDPYNYIKLQDY